MFKLGFAEYGMWILTFALFVCTTLIAIRVLEAALPESEFFKAKLAYVVLISFSFGYASWMLVTLMDTILWGFLMIASVYLLISKLNQVKHLAQGLLGRIRAKSFDWMWIAHLST
jgi:hypothetical protein